MKSHWTADRQTACALGIALMGIFLLLLLIPGLLPFHAMETESYTLFIVWAVLGLAYFRALIGREDRARFMSLFTMENVLSEIERSGIFALSYRLTLNDRLNYVQIKAAMVDEKEGRRLIVGVNDIDAAVRQEEAYAQRLAQAQNMANIDALTQVKNKHAYLDAEEKLDVQIAEHRQPEFAVVILGVNDLKKVNDSEGHQAGDQCMYVNKSSLKAGQSGETLA